MIKLRLVKGSKNSKAKSSFTKLSSRQRNPSQLNLLPPLAVKIAKVESLHRGAAVELERIVDHLLDRLERGRL